MSLISDKYHEERLKQYNINIKTKYIVGNNILERNTNNSLNDDIKSGIRCSKEYYVNNVLKHTEREFDSRIEYTFMTKGEEYNCPNCGMLLNLSKIEDGCPYCKTHYNIDYVDKDLGSKYHYDHVIHSNVYRIITGIIDIVISFLLSFLFIKSTSRTFNEIDIIKIFVYGIILALLLYYLFYSIDAYIVIGPIKRYKERQNNKQKAFWQKSNIDKRKFFNNFNYEIEKYYYNMDNVIDYDILDYLDFKYFPGNKDCVKVKARIRLIYYVDHKIVSKTSTATYTLFKNNDGVTKLDDGINIIMCPNCGASIDASAGECAYCHTKINYLQEWILKQKN